MMLNAIEQLRNFCEEKKYKHVADILRAFDDLSLQFKKYENVQ